MEISTILKETLEKNKNEYIKHLQNLVEIDTENIGHGVLGGKELQGQIYIEKLLNNMGFKTKTMPIKEEHIVHASKNLFEGNTGHNYSYPTERYNLLGLLHSSEKGKSIMFNGHVDTMPAGDTSAWQYDAHKCTIDGKNIYGLGTADMKGGLMASVMAVKLLQDASIPIKGDVSILSVSDEEGGGNGTLSACIDGLKSDYCIVAECSEGSITRAHMGFIIMDIEVSGIALHCGKKWEGENAIEKAISLIKALQELERKWLMNYRHPILPSPTINIGQIEGGVAASTVPDKCIFKICAHILPTMDIKTCIDEIIKTINLHAKADPYLQKKPPIYNITQQGNGFELESSHNFISHALKASENAFGSQLKITGSSSGNDARLIQNISKIPTLIIGPGALHLCHSVDEHIEIQDYLNNILLYANIILQINNKI